MKITDVRVRLIDKAESKMKAIASITIDSDFVVHDIKVIDSDKGVFVSMPSKKDANGDYKDICHPINTKTRLAIQEAVIAKYNEVATKTE